MDFVVGTFNEESLYTLSFHPETDNEPADLRLVRTHAAVSGHSWLTFSANKKFLYGTAWTKPKPSVVAYQVKAGGRDLQFLNAKHVNALPGYVCVSSSHLFSCGGPTGEVFRLESDGSIGNLVQSLDFVTDQGENVSEKRGEVPHGSYGGLRHGSHGVDLSPDGSSLYIPDIGRNCIWTYHVSKTKSMTDPPLTLSTKHITPRQGDGPRHTWPHPNGKVLYCLQEHTSMVDIFNVIDGTKLEHAQGVKIIPADKDPKKYWADEVRLSTGPSESEPRFLYASTRGLEANTKGYVAAFALTPSGSFESGEPLDIWETPTSGGIANAIEPAPHRSAQKAADYMVMTDSEEGWVFILSFDGMKIKEVARLNLGKKEDETVIQAATAVWLGDQGSGGLAFHR